MTMTSIKLKKILDERLLSDDYRSSFNRDKDTYRIEWQDTNEGITITLPNVIAKYNSKGDEAIDELVDHIQEALKIMNEEHELTGMEKQIYPVVRATSFPDTTNAGVKLATREHTAETRVFFAVDLGKSYRLIDEDMLEKEGWSLERLEQMARFNVRSLKVSPKHDRVADNDFYFVATQDGYDASRILNDAFLEEMKANTIGEMAVAVPHQDVLIIADIQNNTGYDILGQMTMKFFAEGRVPITSLPFIYDDSKLEPIFILAKNKPKK
ncbi:UPF0354 protein [Lentibacillus sp. JNUCC-1]|uniref:DUF1444 domain-containing protein n=1 Tax=Lentibacillus sp. JNUCC-1 TaxID=2654513 RepID=UPI0012E97C61|nr:DUF1444 domain-containing protein [Lentibacillus sp. JNUCC-1]MUV39282.1 UPF0354 protein [Lentibacillus sp. JNUCC-1]